MPKLIIFRGLPGSGKTTIANQMGTIVLSPADMYSVRDGEYKWTPEYSEKGKKFFNKIFDLCLKEKIDITIAEVLPTLESLYKYIDKAKEYDYDVEVRDLKISVDESFKRNTHGVPKEHIQIMSELWEDYK